MHILTAKYSKKRQEIKKRLKEFTRLRTAGDKEMFAELCFCILTPQSKAVYCDEAIQELKQAGLLLKGDGCAVRQRLKKVRFPNNKAGYLLDARRFSDIKRRLDPDDIPKTRDWLVKNVKGLGYKEASHFLRNIGMGKDIAILDVHILRNLKRHRVIKGIPQSISKKAYLDIEGRMRKFAEKIRIPLGELDLLFWSGETGFVFK